MQSERTGRPDRTSEEIAAILSRYRASGLGLKRFARQEGLPPGRLHYWLYQRRPGSSARRRRQPASVVPSFQEIKLPGRTLGYESWAVEVSLPMGIAVRFNPTARAEWIGSVVQALQRPC